MKTHSAGGNRIYYIESLKFIKNESVLLLLNEPYSYKDEYGCVVFSGFMMLKNESIPFFIDSGLQNIRFLSTSKNGIFLLENKNEIINAFLPTFRKFYRNRKNSIYDKKGKLLKI